MTGQIPSPAPAARTGLPDRGIEHDPFPGIVELPGHDNKCEHEKAKTGVIRGNRGTVSRHKYNIPRPRLFSMVCLFLPVNPLFRGDRSPVISFPDFLHPGRRNPLNRTSIPGPDMRDLLTRYPVCTGDCL
jgi:hypothetical protein